MIVISMRGYRGSERKGLRSCRQHPNRTAVFEYNNQSIWSARFDGDDTDENADINATIVVTSTCVKYGGAPSQVMEVISMQTSGHSYRNQSGQGSGNTGNAN